MHYVIWITTAVFIGLWSLLAYGVQALLALGTGLTGMPADWLALVAQIPGTAWLEIWWPGWREALVFTVQSAGAVLGWLGGAAPIIVWLMWGLGTLVLVLCAGLLSALVALGRRAAASGVSARASVQAPG